MNLVTPDDAPPAPWCYWVVPHHLLAGCFPGAHEAEAHAARAQRLLDAGITTFLNLMEADERDLSGRPFQRYLPEVAGELTVGQPRMVRLPIRDMDIPTVPEMGRILDTLDALLAEGGTVYVHCWGGVGRTGTVVGCWLLRHGFAQPEDVLERLAELRRADQERGRRCSPETEAQRRFVLSWREPK